MCLDWWVNDGRLLAVIGFNTLLRLGAISDPNIYALCCFVVKFSLVRHENWHKRPYDWIKHAEPGLFAV